MFCVECGKEVGDALSSSGLCHGCFLKKNEFTKLPAHVDFEVCVHCRARKQGEIWIDPPAGGERFEPIVAEAVLSRLDVDRRVVGAHPRAQVTAEDVRNYAVTVTTSGVAEGVPFEESRATRSRVKNATCTRCSRMHGNYYEAIVQVRAERREMARDELARVRAIGSRVIDRIVDEGDRNAFVLKDEEVEGGLDIYVALNNSGRQIGKAIVAEMGGRLREHPKIAGQKDGLEIWRITFAIRLPEYRNGDVVVLGERLFHVSGLTAKSANLRDARTGHQRTVDHEEMTKATVLAAVDAKEAVVVSQTATEAQVLDPSSYATVTVLKPAGVTSFGDTVRVVRWEGELIPLAERIAPAGE